jgi:geranylgeranyl transferase type-2 subunit beta
MPGKSKPDITLMTYLERLTSRLARGTQSLPEQVRSRHAACLGLFQNEDGGFSGRDGGSDLYYTGFALRSLAILGELDVGRSERAAAFLRSRLHAPASIVEFYSLLYSALVVQSCGGPDILADSPADWPDRVGAALESFRTKDGGYGKSSESGSGSTYNTFLVGMCYELLGRSYPDPAKILNFVASRRREDGGYVEIGPMRRSGTNPTAAAVGIVQLVRGHNFDAAEMSHVVGFIEEMGSMEGGLCANSRIPVADLLSTFTGGWTLEQLGALDRIDSAGVLSYAYSLEAREGGFRGGVWDDRADVEYTFYGLGTLALFIPEPPR